MNDNGSTWNERWGEDWLMAAGSLLMSGRAAEGPLPGCSLARAARALNLAAPVPATPNATASARLAARCAGLLHVVDLLAARAMGRGCGGTVTITPVPAELDPDEGPVPVGTLLRLRQVPLSGAGDARWTTVGSNGSDGPAAAGSSRTLAAWIASSDADDVYLYLDVGLDTPPAGTTSLPCATALGFTDLKQDESWLVPVPGVAVTKDASPHDGLASPAATRAVRIRAYGELPATEEELRMADALTAAAHDGRALGLSRVGPRGTQGPAAWTCHPLEGGAPAAHDAIWPVRVFPRTDTGRWPVLVLVASDAGWIPMVVDIVDEVQHAHVARTVTRRHAPGDADRALDVDLWDVPGERAGDMVHLPAEGAGIVLRATEVRRAGGGSGNVANKLAELAAHGWREEDAGVDDEERAVRVWRSGAPRAIVGFAALWRFIGSFGSNVLVEEPGWLRERHVDAARERLMRFAARFAARSDDPRDGRASREPDGPTR